MASVTCASKTFQTGTHAEFLDHYAKLRRENGGDLSGIVLDMRNNPGGLVNEASAIADDFLTSGRHLLDAPARQNRR